MATRFVITIGRFRLLDLVLFDIDSDVEPKDDVRLGSTHEAAPVIEYVEEYDAAFGFGKPTA